MQAEGGADKRSQTKKTQLLGRFWV
jgi:hypothetical protein